MKFLKKIIQKKLAHKAKKVLEKYDPKVIAVTGSVGKTSTKQAIGSLLQDEISVRASKGNLNTEIGMPLAIINVPNPGKNLIGWWDVFHQANKLIRKFDENFPEYLVLEMAADHPGDIDYLTRIAKPYISVVTAVSESHMEFFGSLENIQTEKGILTERADHTGRIVLNADDELVYQMRDKSSAEVVTYGFSERADIRARDFAFEYDDEGNFLGAKFKVSYQDNLYPAYTKNIIAVSQVYAFLASLAVGLKLGIDIEAGIEKMKNIKPEKGRMNMITGIKRTHVIDDTYNSSPRACFNALETLSAMRSRGRKIVVLGDMLELGSFTEKAHQMVGEKIAYIQDLDFLVAVGEKSRDIIAGAKQAGYPAVNTAHFTDNETAGKFVQDKMEEGDIVLIKASRGMHFEQIVKEIMAEPMKADELLIHG